LNNTYYNDLRKRKPLSEEQIKELYTYISTGNTQAINTLVESNLRLVVLLAKNYYKSTKSDNIIEFDDLVMEGNIGLIKAVKQFNPNKGIKFSTYARFWIDAKIINFISNNSNQVTKSTK
jgi:RNA polymerase sigma factor (sigma-70 family)